jgi:hypothetical protein
MNEQWCRLVLKEFEANKPAFDALLDQGICEIRDAGLTDHTAAITEASVVFSGVDNWHETFAPVLQNLAIPEQSRATLSGEIHRAFLAYLLSLCLHRLVWP